MNTDSLSFEDAGSVAERCLCTNLQRAARSVGRRFDEAFRPLDLTNWQFTLMVALNRPEPPTIKVMARDLATDRTTITGSLKPLERRGLLRVTQDPLDGRARRVALTDAGAALLRTAHGIWMRVEDTVERDLAIDDIDRFRAHLRAATAVSAHN